MRDPKRIPKMINVLNAYQNQDEFHQKEDIFHIVTGFCDGKDLFFIEDDFLLNKMSESTCFDNVLPSKDEEIFLLLFSFWTKNDYIKDWRFGQLLVNLCGNDYMSDKELKEKLKEKLKQIQ